MPAFENFTVVSSESYAVYNSSLVPGVDFCNLTVILIDPGSNDPVIAEIWLFLEHIIADCDVLDGVTDGLISRPERCDFDAKKLVGKTVSCSDTGGNVEISAEYADVVSSIIEGARTTDGRFLWFGLPLGAPFSGLANTSFIDGTAIPVPFSSAEAWIEYFVLQNTSFDSSDPATLSFVQFDGIFNKSVERYTTVLGTDEPDLAPTRFKPIKAGHNSWSIQMATRDRLYWSTLSRITTYN